MGVGKSTLTQLLGERLGARTFYETVEDHPFLDHYYQDMPKWAFRSQWFFLTQAFQQHCEILSSSVPCVQDRTIYEHFHVFARSLHQQGIMSDREFAVLRETYEQLTDEDAQGALQPPDVLVYLRASVPVLQQRIAQRDRSCEQLVEASYLEHLELHYEHFIDAFATQVDADRVLIIETDDIDIHVPGQQESLLGIIEEHVEKAARTSLAVA